jgi:hypothetical protein
LHNYLHLCIFLSVLVQILSSTLSQLGVVVSVLATGPKGCRFKAYPCDRFLRAIKICSMPSFGWKVKPESYKKSLSSVNEMLGRKNSHIFCPFLLLASR